MAGILAIVGGQVIDGTGAGWLADAIVVEGDFVDRVEKIEAARNMRHVLVGGRRVAAAGRSLMH